MKAAPAARFDLIDHDGQPRTQSDYAGSFLLVYFGFTHCKVVCPRSLAKLSGILDELGSVAERIKALYITVDPARDTPEVMRAYLAANHRRFTGLTGSSEQIDAAKAAFRVFAERKADPDDPDGYVVPHSAIAYLMAPDGSYRDHFIDALDTTTVRDRIKKAINEERSVGP